MAVKNRLVVLMAERTIATGKQTEIREISEATKISRETLHSYLRQEPTRFDGKVVEALCRYFNVGIDKLLYFEPPIEEESQLTEKAQS
jgi:DNA-binding Xre family transcriptional regulator